MERVAAIDPHCQLGSLRVVGAAAGDCRIRIPSKNITLSLYC
jgi:hypothetical protein